MLMSAAILQGLLEYLKSTLTMDNRQWLAEHLVEPSAESRPYTKEELLAETEASVAEAEATRYYSEEEVDEEIDAMFESWKIGEAA